MNSLKLIFAQSKHFAPALVFASLNVVFGTWAIYIPSIKAKLEINEGQLGLAIFYMALGTLTMIVLAPKIINRFGVGKATAYGIFIFLFSFIIPFIAEQYSWLCVGMYIVGACSGFTDVAMNALVTEIEKNDNVHIMSANHGFFSLGGFLGAGIGGFFLPKELMPINHLLVVIAILLVLNIIFVSKYINVSSIKFDETPFQFKKLKPLFVIAIIAFFIMASEGAIVDWSALYLEKVSLAELSWIGLGYTVFSGTMAFGRFLGDDISIRFGSRSLILVGLLFGILGFGCVLLVEPILAIAGFGLVGLGLSVIIPELFRMAGKIEGIASSVSISFISGIGFMGFLVGPVLLGFLAELASLKLSFLALLGFIVFSFFAAINLKIKGR
jgi:MFS family permease